MQQTVRVNLWPRLSRTRGAAVGLSGIAIVAVLCATLGGDMPHAVPALLLLVPVVLTSVLADRWVALAVAIAGSFVYALVFIPPIGELHVDLAEDAAVLAAFVLVAVTISAISGLRRPAAGADLIDEQRAVLLRGVSHDLRNPLSTIRSISWRATSTTTSPPATNCSGGCATRASVSIASSATCSASAACRPAR